MYRPVVIVLTTPFIPVVDFNALHIPHMIRPRENQGFVRAVLAMNYTKNTSVAMRKCSNEMNVNVITYSSDCTKLYF